MLKLRTLAVLATMRARPYDVLRDAHERGELALLERFIRRGELQVLIGPARKLRLSAAHFEYWGAQAYGVLTGQHELMVQEAMRRTLGPGGVFLDVGCNLGLMSLLGAQLVGPSGRVLAIDPARECVAATEANARLNGFQTISVVHGAAGAAPGSVEVIVTRDLLWTRPARVGEHPLEARRDVVRLLALDELVEERGVDRIDLVKIDVEGAELDVIAGMARLLGDIRPAVVCEMHGRNAEFCAAMRAHGYTVENLDGPEPVERAGGNVHAFCRPLTETSVGFYG